MSSLPYRVAIIGAGSSGLAAAVKLYSSESARPISATIFESRREAGGRTRSFTDGESHDTLDNGQHLLLGCYTSTLSYLRTIGSKHLLQKQNSLEIPYMIPGEFRSSTLKLAAGLPVPLNLLSGLFQTDLLHKYEKIAAMRFGMGLMMFRYDKHMAHASCAELFKFAHQPVTLIEKLWKPIVIGTINLPPEKASAQVFLHLMRIIFLQNRKYSAMLFPKVGLSDMLINPAVKYLEQHGCTIKYGENVRSIKHGNNLIYLESDGGNDVFDALIFAGNYHDASFLPEEVQELIPPITYSPIANAYLWTDKKIIGKPICGFIGTSLEWCFSKPTHTSGELLACTKSAADGLIAKENDEIANIFWNDIKKSFPGSDAKLLRSVIIKEKRATPLLNAELQLHRPKTRTPVPHLYLAGDLVQNGLPMTIEGAVRNGQKAAAEVLKGI
ncbi:MAG: hydroxysqualene dehydroxylase HpnE [Bacteroidota bacterium]|nr:hydroxysqualene dehydroxylase HpnE [Bacteroidota bacterium]MDP4228953.1 hydroxysqualene dehydroxylase HpnE [Bacteroidota bacterium]MDP4237143.1 hydroxysqualene dehydroxylase HpnE [Bacteroidota bacterium]